MLKINITHSTLNIAKAQQYFDLFYRGPIMVSHRLRFRAAIYFCPRWWGSSPYNIQIVESVWGDAFKTETEEWDDGNTVDGDGWSSKCAIETNLQKSGEDSMCKDEWSENIDQGINNLSHKYS